MMTVTDVAKYLDCSARTVRRIMDAGSLKYFAVGKVGRRVSEEQLQEYLLSVERGGEPTASSRATARPKRPKLEFL